MSYLRKSKEGSIEFSWVRKKRDGGPNKNVQYYESFTYDGVEYSLYDVVYMWCGDASEPYIGKLVRIWEMASHEKKVKVVWFLHPTEIKCWLRGIEVQGNEIFLASGEGRGLYNINMLETICGKCNVVCISKDGRNPKLSMTELRMADYVFYRTFDVVTCKISDQFPNMIAGVEVEYFFNQRNDQKLFGSLDLKEKLKERAREWNSSLKFESEIAVEAGRNKAPEESKVRSSEDLLPARVPEVCPPKKRKLQGISVSLKEDAAKLYDRLQRSHGLYENSQSTQDLVIEKIELSRRVEVNEKTSRIAEKDKVEKNKHIETDTQLMKFTGRPEVDSSKWFRQQSWEEKLQIAKEIGSLVLLENLDPSTESSEMEDLVSHACKRKVSAKMIQRSTFSSPYCGQALVVFKSKDEAEFALSELDKRCLMLGSGRPVVAQRKSLTEHSMQSKFFGHLVLDKNRVKQHAEMKNAVSTSHYSQPNTVEFEMALEWRSLQKRSKLWWDALHKKQAKEMARLETQLRAPISDVNF